MLLPNLEINYFDSRNLCS